MTLEELKEEAKRQGYTLIKKRERIPHVRCTCGARGNLWSCIMPPPNPIPGSFIECSKCDKRTQAHPRERDAWKEWYEMNTE